MKSKRSKRKPIPIVAPPLKSLKKARKVTSAFHRITHEMNQLESRGSRSSDKSGQRLRFLKSELSALGGRDAYQQASVVTTSRCSSSKWVLKCLRRRELVGIEPTKPRVLEVGAINTELLDTKGIDVSAIDLLSRNPRIQQRDFFDLAVEELRDDHPRRPFDAIVVSMVLNCVPTPLERGRMLILLKRLLRPHGLLFLTLPLSCLTSPDDAAPGKKARAAPGFNKRAFEALLTNERSRGGLGFLLHEPPDSKQTEKIVHYCLEKNEDEKEEHGDREVSRKTKATGKAVTAEQTAERTQRGSDNGARLFSVVLS